MPLGLAQIGEGYKLGAGFHATPITVTSAFAQYVISAGRRSVEFINVGTQTTYYGGSGVTTATGFPVYQKGQKAWVNVDSGWNIYVCCGSGLTTELRVIEYN